MRCGRWASALLMGLAAFACAARAEPWEVVYDGTVFPEEAGWQRITYGGGAQRWIEDGCLVLDGRAGSSADFYRKAIPSGPGLEETYFTTWRLRVDDVVGFADPGVAVTFASGAVVLVYQENRAYSLLEGAWIPFSPGEFHAYLLTTTDLVNYSLYLDGDLVHAGHFAGSGYEPRVEWGDYGQGARSISSWDHVRMGVIPEPSTGLLVAANVTVAVVLRWRIARRVSHETP